MKSKWPVVVLIVSLAVNLLLIGFLLGQSRNDGPRLDPTQMFPRWARTLPEERRESLRPVLREHFRNIRPQLRDMRRHQRSLYEAIAAEPFDPETVREALEQMHQANSTLQTSTYDSFVDFLSRLTQEERRQFATAPPPRRHERPKPGMNPGMRPPHGPRQFRDHD